MADEKEVGAKPKKEIDLTTNIQSLNEAIDNTSDAFSIAEKKSEGFKESIETSKSVLGDYSNAIGGIVSEISSLSKIMNEGSALTHKQASAISVLTSSLTDSKQLFANFGSGINLDSINTFTEQYNEFSGVIKNIIASSKDVGLDKIQDKIFGSTGLSIPLEIIKKGAGAIDAFAKANFESADAALRLKTAVLQASSATGQLGQVYNSVGEDLQNINNIISQHSELITKASLATNTSHKDVVSYYGYLSKVPGMLSQVIKSNDQYAESMSMLTASIQLSQGTNRNYSEIVKDITTAYRNYNATGEEALNFSARMSEVSNKLGIELEFVEQFVEGASTELGKFGNNTDASAKILLNYGKGLKEVGASGMQTVNIVKEMESRITSLTTAQKAFLSAQSGGPGGLMGSFRIEKLLKERKSNEVFEMIRKQLMKQFGKIVTLDEASQSPQLAAQYQRQRQILTQGPLGGLVKNEGDANRVMEMFKNISTGKTKREELSENSYQDYMRKGRILSEQTQTPFGMFSNMLTQSSAQKAKASLENVEQTFSASRGTLRPEEPDYNQNMRKEMKEKMSVSRQLGSKAADDLSSDLQTGTALDRSGQYMGRSFQQAKQLTQIIPEVVKAPLNTFKSITDDKYKKSEGEEKQKFDKLYANEKKIFDEGKKQTKPEKLEDKRNIFQKAFDYVMPSEKPEPAQKVIDLKEKEKPEQKPDIKKTEKEKVDVNVKVSGYCIDCGKKMDSSAHSTTVNPAGSK